MHKNIAHLVEATGTNTEDIIKAQQKSEEAMERIITNNSGLVWSIVNRFLNRGYSKEELYQIGCIGLIKAVQRFNYLVVEEWKS